MSDSLTEEATTNTGLENEPTGNEVVDNTADNNNQDAISDEQSQEAVSDDGSAEHKEDSGATVTDDGLAKFAKSQGVEDLSTLSDDAKKFLKIAHDNQKAYRSKQNEKKVTDVAKELNTPEPDASEDESFRSEFKQFKYEQQSDRFWSQEGRDKSLEPAMVDVLNEAKEKHGKAYAHTLSQDLETLYDLARLKSGAIDPNAAKEQGRREERESIVKKHNASAPQAHAVSSAPSGTKVDADWIANEYNPSNPEHQKLVADAMRSGLY